MTEEELAIRISNKPVITLLDSVNYQLSILPPNSVQAHKIPSLRTPMLFIRQEVLDNKWGKNLTFYDLKEKSKEYYDGALDVLSQSEDLYDVIIGN